jgi:hypothetical protein
MGRGGALSLLAAPVILIPAAKAEILPVYVEQVCRRVAL